MLAAMRSFFILALFCLVGWSNSQRCPAKYLRFSLQHTFCIAPNPTCQIIRTGVSQQDKDLIVRKHNEFRSKVAMGNEHRSKGGSLPQAADMMQMVWDDELAAVAQKWTENCYFDHDCNECRAVENFPAGQNLAIIRYIETSDPYWESRITSLYDEVVDYYKSWLGSFVSRKEPKTGHFTQLIWSKSWRVGCGYSYYKQGGQFYQYYACNYGPSGNVPEQPVYKQGQPCSACPTNTECSASNRGGNSFPGLCKMENPNTAPAYRINQQGLLYYCGASSSDSDCQYEMSGDGRVQTVNSVGGNYYSIVLRGGQSATMTFTKPIVPHVKPFCLRLTFRKGSLDGRKDESSLVANYQLEHGSVMKMPLRLPKPYFMDYPVDLRWNIKTKLTFTFTVPSGAGEHAFDLRKVMAFDGECAARKD